MVDKADLKANDKVKYTSTGRPYLFGLKGTVKSIGSNNSALVDFHDKHGVLQQTEWIGTRYLEKLPSGPIAEAVSELQNKLQSKKEEITKARADIQLLLKDEDALHKAIDALRVL